MRMVETDEYARLASFGRKNTGQKTVLSLGVIFIVKDAIDFSAHITTFPHELRFVEGNAVRPQI